MTPVFQTKFVDTDGHGNCQSAAMASLLDMPLEGVIDTAELLRDGEGFWWPITMWLKDHGYSMRFQSVACAETAGLYTIGMGPSPRGPFYHAVVCKDGVVVHDPHPSGAGLLEIETHMFIWKVGDEVRR